MSLVVWINGPFGVGKTTVAERLAARHPGALVFDPEIVGSMLRRLLPQELHVPDYQDMPIWRRLVRTTALELVSTYERPLVVPMTLVVPEYFEGIVGGLRRARGTRVAHFTLLADGDTVTSRLAGRNDDEEWAAAQLARCLPALESELFAEHVPTDGRTADDVAQEIVERLPVGLG
jgi:hypothetical protein